MSQLVCACARFPQRWVPESNVEDNPRRRGRLADRHTVEVGVVKGNYVASALAARDASDFYPRPCILVRAVISAHDELALEAAIRWTAVQRHVGARSQTVKGDEAGRRGAVGVVATPAALARARRRAAHAAHIAQHGARHWKVRRAERVVPPGQRVK